MNTLQELGFRLISPSPKLFKRLQIGAFITLVICGILTWLLNDHIWEPAAVVAEKLGKVLDKISYAAGGLALGSALPVTNEKADELQKKKVESKIDEIAEITDNTNK